jgi:hypothetical protein
MNKKKRDRERGRRREGGEGGVWGEGGDVATLRVRELWEHWVYGMVLHGMLTMIH